MYMLSLKQRQLIDFFDTLSFSKEDITSTLSQLVNENFVSFNSDEGTYSLPQK